MKQLNFILAFIFLGSVQNIHAQSEDHDKLENLKYYMTSVKDNVASMRSYTDSVKILSLLDQLDVLTANLESEVNSIILPEVVEQEIIVDQDMDVAISEEEVGEVYTPEDTDSGDKEYKGIGLSKYMPFKKKTNTSFKIGFGINALQSGAESASGVLYPEINTGGSWYWDFGIIKSSRLGGKESKVALNYGISYLKNRFKLENDVLLTTDAEGDPAFVALSNVKDSPKLNIGYLNIPLTFTFALSNKTKLELGGYAGYRIHTVQKNHFKVNSENVHEQRYGRNELNNWLYGATAGINISGFNLTAKYNFSKLFNDNPRYDYNTFMIGTSVSLF